MQSVEYPPHRLRLTGAGRALDEREREQILVRLVTLSFVRPQRVRGGPLDRRELRFVEVLHQKIHKLLITRNFDAQGRRGDVAYARHAVLRGLQHRLAHGTVKSPDVVQGFVRVVPRVQLTRGREEPGAVVGRHRRWSRVHLAFLRDGVPADERVAPVASDQPSDTFESLQREPLSHSRPLVPLPPAGRGRIRRGVHLG